MRALRLFAEDLVEERAVASMMLLDTQRAFDGVAIEGTVVIGEGEMDEAPMLYIGERVGSGGPAMDIAVDPLEGTTLTAKGGPNALAVVALAERGNFLHAPDIYMDKIAVGAGLPDGVVDLDASVSENLRNLARAKKREIGDLVVCMLERPRHEQHVAAPVDPRAARLGDQAQLLAQVRDDARRALHALLAGRGLAVVDRRRRLHRCHRCAGERLAGVEPGRGVVGHLVLVTGHPDRGGGQRVEGAEVVDVGVAEGIDGTFAHAATLASGHGTRHRALDDCGVVGR